MKNNDSINALFQSDALQLSKIMNWVDRADGGWELQDRPALLKHQLSAPLEYDLKLITPAENIEIRDKTLKEASEQQIRTFEDLLHHPNPPLELLKISKDFFKAMASDKNQSKAMQEVAHLFYVMVVLVARVRQRTAISKLTDAELQKGIQWIIDGEWIDTKLKNLVTCCRAQIAT